ncbi:MAG: S-adenosylmethionine synthetase N-terminal domain-containing protein, partial [Deltaproteobacteria bacterium]
MSRVFPAEFVFPGHPDKLCDAIADALVLEACTRERRALVGVEVAVNRGNARRPAGDISIDATGKYVLPGLINAHTQMQSNRSGQSLGGFDYFMKMELANGITTVRE